MTRTTGSIPIPQAPVVETSIADSLISTGVVLDTAQSVDAGDTEFAAKFNSNAAYLEVLAQAGAGINGIVDGLAISIGTGLEVDVTAGVALAGGVVEKDAFSITVTSSQANIYLWLKKDGTATAVNGSITAPEDNAVYLGACSTDGSNVLEVDLSGVVYVYNGVAYREVANVTKPTDTPPSTWTGLTRAGSRTWFWDGSRYMILAPCGHLAKSVAGGTDVTLTAAEYNNNSFEFTGLLTGNINVIVPLVAGVQLNVFNNTTGAFTLTVKGATGTGIAVTQAKRAILGCDGTNVVRFTSDL